MNNDNNTFDISGLNNVETLDDIEVTPANEVTSNNQTSAPQSFIKPVENKVQNTNQLLESVPKPDIMISSPANNSISTDDLLEEYIGKNYNKIIKRFFNFAALLLSGIYFLYRKMYIEGTIIYLISLLLLFSVLIINPLISFGIMILISLVSFFIFNKLYVNSCRRKIDIIKVKNKNKSVADIKNICVRKGGTNLVAALIIPIVLSVFTTVIFNNFFPFGINDIVSKVKSTIGSTMKTSNKTKEKNKKSNISDLKYKTNIVLGDLLDMGYLQIFKATDKNADYSYDYERQTVPDKEDSYCRFNLSVVDGYTSSVELINEMANYYNASSSVTTKKTPSGKTWNTFTVEDEKQTIYSAIENGDYVYLFKYQIDAEASETSEAYYVGILNSINSK